jgi:hypothetical protein
MSSVKMPAVRNAGFDSARCKVWHCAVPHSKAATMVVRIVFLNVLFVMLRGTSENFLLGWGAVRAHIADRHHGCLAHFGLALGGRFENLKR